jgi:hypothetical protein
MTPALPASNAEGLCDGTISAKSRNGVAAENSSVALHCISLQIQHERENTLGKLTAFNSSKIATFHLLFLSARSDSMIVCHQVRE